MIGLIDCAGTNLTSVLAALDRIGVQPKLTSNAAELEQCDKIILPGVGAAAMGMQKLKKAGLIDFLKQTPKPVLGICMGMQLLFEGSNEGDVACLGVIPGRVQELQPKEGITIPHMGWNQLEVKPEGGGCLLLKEVVTGDYCYFVHSFYAPTQFAVATSEHGTIFAAVVANKNFMGCQFHPERSGDVGQKILKNFIEM